MKMITVHPMRLFLPLLVVLGSVATGSYFLEKKSKENWSKAKGLSSSVDVCFQRVTQTFVGVLIGDSSLPFLQENFRGTTSECLAELNRISTAETAKALNTLSDRAYWFHEEVGELLKLSGKNQLSDILNFNRRRSIIERYMKLEDAKWDLADGIRVIEKENSQKKTLQDGLFYSSAAVFMLLSLMLASGDFRRRKGQVNVEEKAYQLYALGPNLEYKELSPLISEALSQSNLKITNDLWNRWGQWWSEKQTLANQKSNVIPFGIDKLVTPSVATKKRVRPQFEVDLGQAWSRVMEMNHQNIFKKGVLVDLQITENLQVLSSNPEIETGLYTILANLLAYSLKEVKGKRISVLESIEGETCTMQICISGHIFNADEMNMVNNLNSHEVDMDLLLVQELVKDLSIELELKNVSSKEYGVESVMEFTFPHVIVRAENRDAREISSANSDSPKLVRLFKGNKKEFLNRGLKTESESNRSII